MRDRWRRGAWGGALLGALGCSEGDDAADDGSTDTGDTGTIATGDCPVAIRHLPASACLMSTLPTTGTTTYTTNPYAEVGGEVAVTVTAVDPADTVVGSAPVGGFPACEDPEHALRLVDSDGETWTLGWSVSGDADALPSTLAVGDTATLRYAWAFTGYSATANLAVTDAAGPRFAFVDPWVDPAWLAPFTLSMNWGDTCDITLDGTGFIENSVTVSGDASVTLYSGQSAQVAVGDRSLEVLVPNAWTYDGCADGCSVYQVVGWE
jgi:hypothetical protein